MIEKKPGLFLKCCRRVNVTFGDVLAGQIAINGSTSPTAPTQVCSSAALENGTTLTHSLLQHTHTHTPPRQLIPLQVEHLQHSLPSLVMDDR